MAFDLLLETHKGTSSILLETERPAVQVQKLVEIPVDVRILRPVCPVIPISDLSDRPRVQGIDLEWDIFVSASVSCCVTGTVGLSRITSAIAYGKHVPVVKDFASAS